MKVAILCCLAFTISFSRGLEYLEYVKNIHLFDAVDLKNATGVTPTTGFVPNLPAYTFTKQTSDLIVNKSVSDLFIKQAFVVNDFTVKAYLKTKSRNNGAILSLSDGPPKYAFAFHILFRWRSSTKAEIILSFPCGNSPCRHAGMITLDGVNDNNWLDVSVRVHIRERLYRMSINNKFYTSVQGLETMNSFPADGILRLAQEKLPENEGVLTFKNRFDGDLQDVKIMFGRPNCTERIVVVPSTAPPPTVTSTACPTQTSVDKNKCPGEDGAMHDDGDKWSEGPCVECSCKMGKTRCLQFCKVCIHEGQPHADGTSWDDSSCKSCSCKDGKVSCASSLKVKQTNGCERTCSDSETGPCPPGCVCPENMVLIDGECKSRISCPCVDNNGKTYPAGSVKESTCEYCTCEGRKFNCFKFC